MPPRKRLDALKGLAAIFPNGIGGLTVQEWLEPIRRLWDSLANHDVVPIRAQRAELDRRLAALRAEPGKGASWESLRAELRRPR